MRRALPILPLILLAACEADHTAARDVLTNWGYTRIELRAAPWLANPCAITEPVSVGYTASRDGRRWSAVLCAASESLHDARRVGEREVGRAPSWDSFSRRELPR